MIKKQTVIEKLQAFFEKYFGLVSPIESKIVNAQDTTGQVSLGTVAEETAPYGKLNHDEAKGSQL